MAYNFKSEEDVKEYLTNLGIEYRFGCYKEKNPEGKRSLLLIDDNVLFTINI